MAFILLPLEAVTFGELRLLSQSVWPAWLMHSIANLFTFSARGLVALHGSWGTLLAPGTEGVVFSILFATAGFGLYRIRARHSAALTALPPLAAALPAGRRPVAQPQPKLIPGLPGKSWPAH